MNFRSVRWTRRALMRLDQIGAHIAKDNPEAAARVVAHIAASVKALTEHPAMGRAGRLSGTRELVVSQFPYIVAYRVTAETIDILTVLHGAQQWPMEL
jgi:addiction module RelE/StbE family toxin